MNERERMDAWKEIEGNLLSEELVPIIPAQEWKGLTLLVENLVSSNVCSTEEKGRIVAELDSDVEVVLLFEKMLRRRIDFLSLHGLSRPLPVSDPTRPPPPDCHHETWVRRKSGNEVGDMWARRTCILATSAGMLPVTDLAVTFVLWAEAGFPEPPKKLGEEVALIKLTEDFVDFRNRVIEEERVQNERLMEREERRRRELERIREQIEQQDELEKGIEDADKEISRMSWRELMEVVQSTVPDGDQIGQHKKEIAERMLCPAPQ